MSDQSAGTDYAINRLCEALGCRGLAVQLHTLNPVPSSPANGYERFGYPQVAFPAKLAASPGMRQGLQAIAPKVDVIHCHGLWRLPNVYAAEAARHAGRPFVFSVHGMMSPAALKRSRWKKAIFGWLGQRRSLASVNCFHATSQEEHRDIRRLGFRQPVSVVPFGIDLPKGRRKANYERRTVLFLGRIDPIKRIDVLLMAWRAVQVAYPNWDLVICGPDNDGHLPTLQRLAKELGIVRVSFVGPKYGSEKEALLDACDLFVLPSFSENFGFVVAEALAHAVPAIVTRTAPWDGLLHHSCGWWIDISPESLERSLREALALSPSVLKQMGQRGRDWMARDLSWDRSAEMMALTYEWLLDRSGMPSWVAVD